MSLLRSLFLLGCAQNSSFAAHVSRGQVFCLVRGGRDGLHPDPLPQLICP